MADFITTVNRILLELRRSNLATEAKAAINDAIKEAAKTRFFFNEMKGVSFPTVIGQEYYADQGIVEIDTAYYLRGASRYNLWEDSNLDANVRAYGTTPTSSVTNFSRSGALLRLYPIPSEVITIQLEGFGRLTPYPLVADADTNAWLDDGEMYIRALAKRNLLRDVIRDYGEARALDAIAEDYKNDLLAETYTRQSTDTLKATQF